MYSVLQRFVTVTTITFSVMACIAVVTASSSVLREWLLQPRPVLHKMHVVVTPVQRAVVDSYMPVDQQLNLYAVNGTTLEDHITLLNKDLHLYVDEHGRRTQLQPIRRSFDRVFVLVNGSVDLSQCWDWNTRSIFVLMLARYRTSRAAVNEVVFLDAMLRSVAPASMLSLHRARHKSRSDKDSAVNDVVVDNDDDEQQRVRALNASARGAHDHPSIILDHERHRIYFHNSYKYALNDMYKDTLAGTTLDIIMRYQVFSYSGYTPVREVVVATTQTTAEGNDTTRHDAAAAAAAAAAKAPTTSIIATVTVPRTA